MLTALPWILAAVALVGTVFNVRQDLRCFYFWSVSNIGLCVFNVVIGQYAQALLFGVYWLLALQGLKVWRKKESERG